MSTLFAFEQRWLLSILKALLPSRADQPGFEAVNFSEFWPLFKQAATPLLVFGVRAATWFVFWTPFYWIGRWRNFNQLSPDEQDRVINRAATAKFFLVRQMLNTLKIVACFAYFREPLLRQPFRQLGS